MDNLSCVMPGLVPDIYVFFFCRDVDGRDIGVRKHAVLRTAMPGHDSGEVTRGKMAPRTSDATCEDVAES